MQGAVPARAAGADWSYRRGSLIAAWFGDSTVLALDATQTTDIGDRLRISYRFTGVENGEPYVVEQHLFCTVRDGKIEQADLLCSGFRPRQE